MTNIKKAVAILTYCRFDYFETVIRSIISQNINNKPLKACCDIFIFQDGLWENENEANIFGHKRISEFIKSLPKHINIIQQRKNLGVALHYDFAERLLFIEHAYDFVTFCEDDLIFGPGYMQTILLLADKFHNDSRVGMVSAFPNNPTTPLETQIKNKDRYTQMGHNWGFGISRTFWLKRQPLVDIYLEIISDTPYRARPTELILNWLERIGLPPNASSQDYVKLCATAALGACRLATVPNFGLPIGRSGLHFTPKSFKNMGFDRTVVFNQSIKTIAELDDTQFRTIYTQHADIYNIKFRVEHPDEITNWQKRLLAGEFHPNRILCDQMTSSKIVPATPMIRSVPHMEEEGISLFKMHLEKTMAYLEYGSGGSTVLAAEMGVKQIHSIDSDAGFLAAVQEKIAETGSPSSVIAYPVDIGRTKEWGQPDEPTAANRWPRYCVAAWGKLLSEGIQPDLILIDGRFRVACFLASLLLAKPGTIILFDDYFDRPNYHVVEKYLKPSARAGRMAEFIVDSSFNSSSALIDLLMKSTDPA